MVSFREEMTMPVRPTPTQDENDRAARGEHFTTHEDDGSGPDPYMEQNLKAQQSLRPIQVQPRK